MGKLKYAFSVIVLIGVTVAFSFAFEAYTESDYENKDGDIRELETVSEKESFNEADMLNVLTSGDYQEINFEQVYEDDEEIRKECALNVKKMLLSDGDSQVFSNIEKSILEGKKLEIAIYHCVGYIGKEAVVFDNVSVWMEDILVRYEQNTGVVFQIEYYVHTDKGDKTYLDECRNVILKNADKYFRSFGVSEDKIVCNTYGMNTNLYAVSAQTIVKNYYSDAEDEKMK